MRFLAAILLALSCSSPHKQPAPTPQPQPEPDDMAKKKSPTPEKQPAATVDDPNLWLEDIKSDKALAWAREQNKKSEGEIETHPSFTKSRDRIRAILDSK